MGKYGLKIKNYHAAILYEVVNGVRDYISDSTDAMLNNSLFLYYMQKHGLSSYKDESTRDIICLNFDFGSKSYEDEKKRLDKAYKEASSEDERRKLHEIMRRVNNNKEKYKPLSREALREYIYENGINIEYVTKATKTRPEKREIIHYKYLFRTPAKAKLGQAMFINEKLYDTAKDWLTMGLYKRMPEKNAKIVELSAYSSLVTSSVVGTMHLPIKDVAILKDQDSFFRTIADIVRAEDYNVGTDDKPIWKKRCVVATEETDVKNTLWDGMGLIESCYMPEYANGMVLLRNHFFKMCGFRTNMQLFFKDWCEKNGYDYETYFIRDMFGKKHRLKDIKILTTDNAIKWKKFIDIMGGTKEAAYKYWADRLRKDYNTWGIVKTDHPSKLGEYQQMSYQMINTLPCTKEDIRQIADVSIKYIESLKEDNDAFEGFLRKNANAINHYEMLADLYEWNKDFANSEFFRYEKKKIIYEYISKLKSGKVFVNADNLTLCGNPYALLLYSVGEDWEKDPTFSKEENAIQCYTTRFEDDEYLCCIRSPHNSPNNLCYMHNVYSEEMKRYFPFSKNIIAVNNINTPIQARLNGADYDLNIWVSKEVIPCKKTLDELQEA